MEIPTPDQEIDRLNKELTYWRDEAHENLRSALQHQTELNDLDQNVKVLLARIAEREGSEFANPDHPFTTDLQEAFHITLDLLKKHDARLKAAREAQDAEMVESFGVAFAPLTEEQRATFPPETQAYWKFVRAVLRTDRKYPIAKIAWDFGVEWGRRNPPPKDAA